MTMSSYVRFSKREGLYYDPSYDRISLNEKYYGISPIVGVKEIIVGECARSGADLHAFRKISIYSGAIIVGNVYAEEEIEITTNKPSIAKWGTIIVGDVYSKNIHIHNPRGGGSETVLIYGNLIGENIVIEGPTIIRGNLLAKRELVVKEKTFTLGRTRVGFGNVAKGKAYIEKFGSVHIYINGDLTLGDHVTTIAPIIASRGGDFKVRDSKFRVRVINIPCLLCGEKNPLFCNQFFKDTCDIYDYMDAKDFAIWEDRKFIAWYWRATPKMILQHFVLDNIYRSSLKKIKNPVLETRSISGIPFEEFLRYVLKETFLMVLSRKQFEEWLSNKFKKYIENKGLKPVYCDKCGFPNIPAKDKTICIRCGNIIGGRIPISEGASKEMEKREAKGKEIGAGETIEKKKEVEEEILDEFFG